MTSMERVIASVSGGHPDRVPLILNLLDQGARELDLDIQAYYSSGEHVARAQLAMQKRLGHDNLWGSFFAAEDTLLLGAKRVNFYENGAPNVGEMLIRSEDDIDRILQNEIPEDYVDHPAFQASRTAFSILKNEAGGRVPVLGLATSSISLPAELMGMERWMGILMSDNAGLRRKVLELSSRFVRAKIRSLRRAGSDFIAYVLGVGTADILPAGRFNELVLPFIKSDLDELGYQDMVLFNGGGRINPLIPSMLANTGFGVYYINPYDSISEAKTLMRGRGLVVAPINDIPLIHQTPEVIDREVARIMNEGKSGGHFAFGTLVMPYLIPEASIQALVQAAFRHGTYA